MQQGSLFCEATWEQTVSIKIVLLKDDLLQLCTRLQGVNGYLSFHTV